MAVPFHVHRVVSPIVFSGGHVMIMVAVPVVMAGLVYLLKGTAAGRAIRGTAENIERARLSGVPVRRLSTRVWGLAAVLSAFAAVFATPAPLGRLPEVIGVRRFLYLAALVAVLVFRASVSIEQLSLLGTVTAVYALVALSLVVLTGWTGQISLGQFAVVGVGAVAAGDLLTEAHAHLFLALLGAAFAGLVTSLALGLPALRGRGL